MLRIPYAAVLRASAPGAPSHRPKLHVPPSLAGGQHHLRALLHPAIVTSTAANLRCNGCGSERSALGCNSGGRSPRSSFELPEAGTPSRPNALFPNQREMSRPGVRVLCGLVMAVVFLHLHRLLSPFITPGMHGAPQASSPVQAPTAAVAQQVLGRRTWLDPMPTAHKKAAQKASASGLTNKADKGSGADQSRQRGVRTFVTAVRRLSWAVVDTPIRVVEFMLLGPSPLPPKPAVVTATPMATAPDVMATAAALSSPAPPATSSPRLETLQAEARAMTFRTTAALAVGTEVLLIVLLWGTIGVAWVRMATWGWDSFGKSKQAEQNTAAASASTQAVITAPAQLPPTNAVSTVPAIARQPALPPAAAEPFPIQPPPVSTAAPPVAPLLSRELDALVQEYLEVSQECRDSVVDPYVQDWMEDTVSFLRRATSLMRSSKAHSPYAADATDADSAGAAAAAGAAAESTLDVHPLPSSSSGIPPGQDADVRVTITDQPDGRVMVTAVHVGAEEAAAQAIAQLTAAPSVTPMVHKAAATADAAAVLAPAPNPDHCTAEPVPAAVEEQEKEQHYTPEHPEPKGRSVEAPLSSAAFPGLLPGQVAASASRASEAAVLERAWEDMWAAATEAAPISDPDHSPAVAVEFVGSPSSTTADPWASAAQAAVAQPQPFLDSAQQSAAGGDARAVTAQAGEQVDTSGVVQEVVEQVFSNVVATAEAAALAAASAFPVESSEVVDVVLDGVAPVGAQVQAQAQLAVAVQETTAEKPLVGAYPDAWPMGAAEAVAGAGAAEAVTVALAEGAVALQDAKAGEAEELAHEQGPVYTDITSQWHPTAAPPPEEVPSLRVVGAAVDTSTQALAEEEMAALFTAGAAAATPDEEEDSTLAGSSSDTGHTDVDSDDGSVMKGAGVALGPCVSLASRNPITSTPWTATVVAADYYNDANVPLPPLPCAPPTSTTCVRDESNRDGAVDEVVVVAGESAATAPQALGAACPLSCAVDACDLDLDEGLPPGDVALGLSQPGRVWAALLSRSTTASSAPAPADSPAPTSPTLPSGGVVMGPTSPGTAAPVSQDDPTLVTGRSVFGWGLEWQEMHDVPTVAAQPVHKSGTSVVPVPELQVVPPVITEAVVEGTASGVSVEGENCTADTTSSSNTTTSVEGAAAAGLLADGNPAAVDGPAGGAAVLGDSCPAGGSLKSWVATSNLLMEAQAEVRAGLAAGRRARMEQAIQPLSKRAARGSHVAKQASDAAQRVVADGRASASVTLVPALVPKDGSGSKKDVGGAVMVDGSMAVGGNSTAVAVEAVESDVAGNAIDGVQRTAGAEQDGGLPLAAEVIHAQGSDSKPASIRMIGDMPGSRGEDDGAEVARAARLYQDVLVASRRFKHPSRRGPLSRTAAGLEVQMQALREDATQHAQEAAAAGTARAASAAASANAAVGAAADSAVELAAAAGMAAGEGVAIGELVAGAVAGAGAKVVEESVLPHEGSAAVAAACVEAVAQTVAAAQMNVSPDTAASVMDAGATGAVSGAAGGVAKAASEVEEAGKVERKEHRILAVKGVLKGAHVEGVNDSRIPQPQTSFCEDKAQAAPATPPTATHRSFEDLVRDAQTRKQRATTSELLVSGSTAPAPAPSKQKKPAPGASSVTSSVVPGGDGAVYEVRYKVWEGRWHWHVKQVAADAPAKALATAICVHVPTAGKLPKSAPAQPQGKEGEAGTEPATAFGRVVPTGSISAVPAAEPTVVPVPLKQVSKAVSDQAAAASTGKPARVSKIEAWTNTTALLMTARRDIEQVLATQRAVREQSTARAAAAAKAQLEAQKSASAAVPPGKAGSTQDTAAGRGAGETRTGMPISAGGGAGSGGVGPRTGPIPRGTAQWQQSNAPLSRASRKFGRLRAGSGHRPAHSEGRSANGSRGSGSESD